MGDSFNNGGGRGGERRRKEGKGLQKGSGRTRIVVSIPKKGRKQPQNKCPKKTNREKGEPSTKNQGQRGKNK